MAAVESERMEAAVSESGSAKHETDHRTAGATDDQAPGAAGSQPPGVLRNVRVIDDDAVDTLVQRLEALLSRTDASMAKLAGAVDEAARTGTGVSDECAQLEDRLKLAVRMLKALQIMAERSESLADRLQADNARVENFIARLEAASAAHEQRMASMEAAFDERLESIAEKRAQQAEQRLDEIAARARTLASIVDQAETNMALLAMRSAVNTSRASKAAEESATLPSPAPAPPREAPKTPQPNPPRETPPQPAPSLDRSAAKLEQLAAHCDSLQRRLKDEEHQRTLIRGMHEELRAGIDDLIRIAIGLRGNAIDETQRHQVQRVEQSLSTLLDMARSITEIGRNDQKSESSGVVTAFEPRVIIDGMAGRLTPKAADRGLTLTAEIDSSAPELVRGDSGRFKQLLLYFINGAMKLSGPGALTIRATGENRGDDRARLRVEVAYVGQRVRTWKAGAVFGDIPETVQGPMPSESTPGGLGMLIARRLVEDLGGRVGAECAGESNFTLWFYLNLPVARDVEGEERRASQRYPLESVRSNLGEVLDLSLTGTRIMSVKPVEGHVEVRLEDLDHAVTLIAEVVRCTKIGWRKHEVGLRFLHVSAEAAEKITRIATQNRIRRIMGNDE